MKLHTFVMLLALAPVALAQGKTTTDFGVAVQQGTATGFDGKPQGTAITATTPLRISAAAGYSYARAYGYVYRTGLSLSDYGSAYVPRSSKASAAAGTTTNKSGAIGAAHGVATSIPSKAGTKGRLVISWYRSISKSGVSLRAGVSVGGKPAASFTHADASKTKYVDVTIPSSGKLDLSITSSGRAAVAAPGRAYYSANVRVYFQAGIQSGKCKISSFGKGCGLAMTGTSTTITRSTLTYHSVILSISPMKATETGLLAMGAKLGTPVKLPAGGCDLLVNPTVIVPIRYRTSVLFRNKSAFDTNMQAVKFSLSSGGVKITTSNGLHVDCPKT